LHLHRRRFSTPQVEDEQVLVGRRRTKERVKVYEDLGGEFGSAGGMVDGQPDLVAHDEWIGSEGFGTIGTPFRQACNPRPQALFVVHDEHMVFSYTRTPAGAKALHRSV
jgi:hypothetical protein